MLLAQAPADASSSTANATITAVSPPTGIAWKEAIQTGVVRNQGLLTQRLEQRRQEIRTRAVWSQWSPSLFLDTAYRRNAFDDSFDSAAGVVSDDRLGYAVGADWRSVIGTNAFASVGVEQGLGDSGGNQPTARVGLTQPLLQGAWLTGAGLPLTEANLTSRIQSELFRNELNSFIVDVDAAYWSLALAQADLDIKTRSLARAQAQYDDTQENIRRGILAAGEIYVVEESLVIFQQELARARQRLLLARRGVQRLLYKDDVEAAVEVLDPDVSGAVVPDKAAAVDDALAHNPQVLAQRWRVALAKERAKFQLNQALPALDLRTSASLQSDSDDYGQAWQDLVAHPRLNAEVGLRFSVALDRWAVNASVDAADVDVAREEAELARVENAVSVDVKNAVDQLATDVALAAGAQRQLTLADLKLKAQMEKYKSGLSTLQDVVRFQRELDDAMISARRVVKDVRTGRARLLQQTGALHDVVGVGVGVDLSGEG